MPYSRLAELLRQHFGRRSRRRRCRSTPMVDCYASAYERSPLTRDQEVRDAVLDLLGRLNGREIMEVLAERFDPSRLPSRSALYRLIAKEQRAPLPGHEVR